jgi:hypothetical protein
MPYLVLDTSGIRNRSHYIGCTQASQDTERDFVRVNERIVSMEYKNEAGKSDSIGCGDDCVGIGRVVGI